MRARAAAVLLGLSLQLGTGFALAADVSGPPPTPAPSTQAGSKAPETVPLMTKGRKHAIIAGLIAAIFLIVGAAAGRNDKAGAGERLGPRSK